MSVIKVLLVIAIIWLVWRGFNRIAAFGQASRNQQPGPDRPSRPHGSAQGSAQGTAPRPVEDMVKCPKCGAYVSAQAHHRCE
jgi:hypothetical protein